MLSELYAQMVTAFNIGDIETLRHLVSEYRTVRRASGAAAEDLDKLLRAAIEADQHEMLEILLTAGVDIGKEDRDGRRLVHLAAFSGSVSVLRSLIRAGAPLNAVDRNGSSALNLCLLRGHHDAALVLIEAGASVNRPRCYDSGEAPLHTAARFGDAVIMQAALRRGAGRPDLHASDGKTPLHIAAHEKYAGCVEHLCAAARRGAVNTTDNCNVTPLHCAVQASALDVVRILLRYGANPNATDKSGLTPLHYSAAAVTTTQTFSQTEIVDLLIACGACVRLRDHQRRSPLHLAASRGNVALVRMLLRAGAEVDAVERLLGETAINIAAAYGRYGVMCELCNAGCDVNIADVHGVAPLCKLLSTAGNVGPYKYESVELLLLHGAKVNMPDSRGVTPLEACVFNAVVSRNGSDISILRRLASAGALLEPRPNAGQRSMRNSPLCWLTWHGELAAAAFLVNAGWNLRDEKWLTLPGKTESAEAFLSSIRTIASMPLTLRASCRDVIRGQLRWASQDCDVVPLIERLPLPIQIQKYLTLDTEHDVIF